LLSLFYWFLHKGLGKLCCISSRELIRIVYALVKRCVKTWQYCGCSLLNHLFVIYFNVTASKSANIIQYSIEW